MITCERLTVRVTADSGRAVLRNLSMRLEPGVVRAIVGGAGSGKTVLGAALRDNLPAGLVRERGGVRVSGGAQAVEAAWGSAAGTPSWARGGSVAWLDQAAEAGIRSSATVRVALSAALETRFPGATPDDLTLCAALARLGVNDARLLDAGPDSLAPGLLRRVALSQALVRPVASQPPALVVFDEPLAGLDIAVAEEVLAAIAGMRRAIRASVVVLSRDLSLAQRYADEISVLEGGQLVETFYPERVLSGSAGWDGAVSLLPAPVGAVSEAPQRAADPRRVAQRAWGANPGPSAERAGSAELAAKPASNDSAERRVRRALSPNPALELRGVSVLFPDGSEAIAPVSVSLAPGEGLAVTGPARSGKSMLALALVGGLQSSSALRVGGEMLLGGEVQAPRAAARTAAERRAIQLVLFDHERPAAEVHTVRTQLRRAVRRARPGASASAVGVRVEELLSLVGLGPEVLLVRVRDLPVRSQRRLAIARALAHDPGVIVCDGPGATTGQEWVFELCARLRRATGVAVVLLTRSSGAARASSDRELRLGAVGGPELVACGAGTAGELAPQAA